MQNCLSKLYLFSFLLAMLSCSGEESKEFADVDPAFATYVQAFSSGYQSRKNPITVRFHKPPEKAASVEDLNALWEIRPAIPGKARWKDSRTLIWEPEAPLPSATRYSISLDLDALMEVKSGLETFSFDMQTYTMTVGFSQGNLESKREDNYQWNSYKAVLESSDWLSEEEIQNAFAASQNGRNLSVRWERHLQGKLHSFVLDSIERKEEAGTVQCAVQGASIGMEEDVEHSFSIPSIFDFFVTQAEAISGEEGMIRIHFSDPLDRSQEFEGKVLLSSGSPSGFFCYGHTLDIRSDRLLRGEITVELTKSIRNSMGNPLKLAFSQTLSFEQEKPALRPIGKGFILPTEGEVFYPFEAVNLKAVHLKVLEIKEQNLHQFFQVNALGEEEQLNRVARQVVSKTIPLPHEHPKELAAWKRYHINLGDLLNTKEGSVFQVVLGFGPQMTTLACSSESEGNLREIDDASANPWVAWKEEDEAFDSWGYSMDLLGENRYYSDPDYNWNERENPCNPAYYTMGRFLSRALLVSRLGLSAHQTPHQSFLFVTTDLITGEARSAAQIQVFDFQKNLLFESTTNGDGFVEWPAKVKARPFLVSASHQGSKAYLRLTGNDAVDLSFFPVEGSQSALGGTKIFTYTERGVRRPGDSIFVGCIIEDRQAFLPEGLPVVLELRGPENQELLKLVEPLPKDGHLMFRFATAADAPTGNYRASIQAGPLSTVRSLLVETVKPNRLAIETRAPSVLHAEARLKINAQWLHGAPAGRLKTDVLIDFSNDYNPFAQWKGFHFPALPSHETPAEMELFEGSLREDGAVEIPLSNLSDISDLPLKASVQIKVYEPSGNFSTDKLVLPMRNAKTYPGLKLPKEAESWEGLKAGQKYPFQLVLLNREGMPKAGRLRLQVAKLEEVWWWDVYSYGDGNYRSRKVQRPFYSEIIQVSESQKSVAIAFPEQAYGAYEVKLTELNSGRSAEAWVYVRNSRYAERGEGNEQISLLDLSPSKSDYKVGDKLQLNMASSQAASVLVLVENSRGILHKAWVRPSELSSFSHTLSEAAAPNVFVSAWAFLPHKATLNGSPARLLGMCNVPVLHPNAALKPKIDAPEEVRPSESFQVQVSEANGMAMSYSIALVDQGLLSLTRFKTPDPFAHFFAPEAFAGKKWDMYDKVMQAFSLDHSKALLTGGDAAIDPDAASKARRFEPVVRVLGPFNLPKGSTQKHRFNLPNYMGKLRLMVVAHAKPGSYGSTEKYVKVSQPLMALGTLPRVLRTNETTRVPVTVFAGKPGIGRVKARIKLEGPLELVGSAEQEIEFREAGEKTIFFEVKAKEQVGKAQLSVHLKASGQQAEWSSPLSISYTSAPVRHSMARVLAPGESIMLRPDFVGIPKTRQFSISASCAPPIHLEEHLDYLLTYPYGCTEQISSKLLAQLALPKLLELSNKEQAQWKFSVQQGLESLSLRQSSDGGIKYWPGQSYSDYWASFHAGLAMLTAQEQGFVTHLGALQALLEYGKQESGRFRFDPRKPSETLSQAQWLFLLAKAGKPNVSAMNYLRDRPLQDAGTLMFLGAAYALSGNQSQSQSLLLQAGRTGSTNWRSNLMDQRALALIIGQKMGAKDLVQQQLMAISEDLSGGQWHPTFSRALALHAVADRMHSTAGAKPSMALVWNGTQEALSSNEVLLRKDFGGQNLEQGVRITNTSGATLFVHGLVEEVPYPGREPEISKGFSVNTRFLSINRKPIDVKRLSSGTDFIMELKLEYLGLEPHLSHVVWNQWIPSGWEIRNKRGMATNAYNFYQDIRDDRVFTAFDLQKARSSTLEIHLTATYPGSYVLPGTMVEAMYLPNYRYQSKSSRIEVFAED